MKRIVFLLATLLLLASPIFASQTWFVRSDGGTRVSANVPGGACDGLSDLPAAGATGKHCAFNDFRYMWSDNSGAINPLVWVSGVGDTVVIRGCQALGGQVNPSNPNCRLGWDNGVTGALPNGWNLVSGSNNNNTAFNPPIPANTTILGGCAFGTNTCNPANGYPYTSNLAQLFCGFGLTECFDLRGSSGVTIKGIEITTHNQHFNGTAWSGNCTIGTGAPADPVGCSTGGTTVDDYAQNAFFTDANTVNLTLTDVYIHGFDSSAFFGPIGANITMTRVIAAFNAFAGWNFDNGAAPNGANASITGSYVIMYGNGFYEEYPIVHTQFPARAGYDTNSAGFGDAWSGQSCTQSTQPTCMLVSFTCDHCASIYNTKDGWLGPHVPIQTNIITNGQFYGNMGEQLKYGSTGSDISVGGTVLVQNNFIEGSCNRLSTTPPGAAHSFNASTGLAGAHLAGFCRAGGNILQSLTQIGSTVAYYGNTFVLNGSDGLQFDCGPVGGGSTNCGSVPFVFKDNIFLGYTNPVFGAPSHLFEINAGTNISITSAFNLEFGLSGMDTCGTNGIICSSPLLTGQPATPWPGSESAFDNFNFLPAAGSPPIGAGTAVAGLTTDFAGNTRPNPPSMGALEQGGGTPTVATPTASPVAGTYTSTQTVTLSTVTAGATICGTVNGSTPTSSPAGTCLNGTSGPFVISTTTTVKAIGTKSGDTDSSVFSGLYTITLPAAPTVNTTNVKLGGKLVLQ